MTLTINDYSLYHAKLNGYQISDQDVDSGDSDIIYFGYVNQRGEWYIMKEDQSVGGDANVLSWRFYKGDSGYSTNWANRESLTPYETYDEIDRDWETLASPPTD